MGTTNRYIRLEKGHIFRIKYPFWDSLEYFVFWQSPIFCFSKNPIKEIEANNEDIQTGGIGKIDTFFNDYFKYITVPRLMIFLKYRLEFKVAWFKPV